MGRHVSIIDVEKLLEAIRESGIPLPQIMRTVRVIGRTGPWEPEQFLNFFHSPVFPVVLEAAKLGTLPSVHIPVLKHILGLPQDACTDDVFLMEVDYRSVGDMIVAGRYDWFDGNIVEENFPIHGSGAKHFECKLFPAACSSEEGFERIAREDTKHPWEPAKIEHILSFGATFPDIRPEYDTIAGLGSVACVIGYDSVPCLDYHDDGGLTLFLQTLRHSWKISSRFLGVREISNNDADSNRVCQYDSMTRVSPVACF